MAFWLVDPNDVVRSAGCATAFEAQRAYMVGPGKLSDATVDGISRDAAERLFKGAVAKGWRILYADDYAPQTKGKKWKG